MSPPVDALSPGGGVDGLIVFLRARGFPVGPAEAVDAARLIAHLARSASPSTEQTDPAGLIPKLRPVLCKRQEDQARFDALFHEWANALRPQRKAVADTPHTTTTAPPTRTSIWRNLALLVFSIIMVLAWWDSRQRPTDTPAVQEAVKQSPVAPTTSPPPAPVVKKAPPRFTGYTPAVRYNWELRPWVAGALLGLGALGLLGLTLPLATPWLGHARRSGRRVPLDLTSLREEARRIVPPLSADIQARLERHVAGPATARSRLQRRPPLHIGRTIEATARRLGVLSLRHRDARLRPSYLLIVEVDADAGQTPHQLISDPRGRMFYHWTERLRKHGIDVDIRLARFDAETQTARVCRPTGTGWRLDGDEGESLDRLPTPPVGQRLVIVSDGHLLIDADHQWRDWAVRARFHRWPQRVMFTPTEPRHWGAREDAIERRERPTDPGFYVLPLDEPALAAWAELVVTGRLPRFTLSRSQRYPARLRALEADNRIDALLDPDTPIDGLAELLDQLKYYLGENGYYWLCACAVPPIIRWELTLLLGEQYYLNAKLPPEDLADYIANDYPRLAMLPWLRRQRMPDWLRLALLDSLSPSVQEEVRAVVRNKLGQIQLDARGDDALSLEEPPGPLSRAPSTATKDTADTLYLGYLAGHTPRQLMLRAPSEWSVWLAQLPVRQRTGLWREWLTAWRDRLLWRNGLSFYGSSRRMLRVSTGVLAIGVVLSVTALRTEPDTLPTGARDALYTEQGRWTGGVQSASIRAVAYGADGATIISIDWDGGQRQWNARTGGLIGTLLNADKDAISTPPFTSVAFSADARHMATGDADGMLRLWDVRTGKTIDPPIQAHDGMVSALAFSPDGSVIASSGATDTVIRQWNTATAEAVNRPMPPQNIFLTSLAYSPDGRRLVSGSGNGEIQLWDASTGQAIGPAMAGHEDEITSVAFSPDGAYLLSGSNDASLRLWDAKTGNAVGPPMRGHGGPVNSLAFSPDGAQVVSGGADGTLRFWTNRPNEDAIVTLNSTAEDADVYQAVFSPDGTKIATAGKDGAVRLWNAATGQAIGAPLQGHTDSVLSVAFSPDGSRIVSGSWDKTLRLWDATTGQAIGAPLQGHADPVQSVAFSPDGSRIVSGSNDNNLRLWDAITGQTIGEPLQGHSGPVNSVAFSPDGSRIVSGSSDTTLRLWRAATGQSIGEPLRGHSGWVLGAAFSPDGSRIVSGSNDTTLRLWDAATGQSVGAPLQEHSVEVRSVAFSPDGKRIVSGSYDASLRLWDAATGKGIGQPIAQTGRVFSVAFSPDGARIVSAWIADQPVIAPQLDQVGGPPNNTTTIPTPQEAGNSNAQSVAPPTTTPEAPAARTPQQKLPPRQKQISPPQKPQAPAKKSHHDTGARETFASLLGDIIPTAQAATPAMVLAQNTEPQTRQTATPRAILEGEARAQSSASAPPAADAPAPSGGVQIWRVPPYPLPLRPAEAPPQLWTYALLAALGLWPILLIQRRRRLARQIKRRIAEADQ
ncbi:hypothetical protein FHP89_02370 [Denitromonas ohlonensis]|uniref:Uncharacterized protein n=2 Tax=Denitromonas TaxID=139331 RepID=A0A557RLG4_9RHOO|nr:hypothetical protein FHP90_11185 [Denitromonas ohlonensis]TVO79613.1 hypothetical protein FHP89_02370 [Denitromonas ohlonensis]